MNIEHIKPVEDSKTIQFLREQTECPLCHGSLDIFVECIDAFQVKEEARCTQCMALSRVESHYVH